jgi:hypothetical protein
MSSAPVATAATDDSAVMVDSRPRLVRSKSARSGQGITLSFEKGLRTFDIRSEEETPSHASAGAASSSTGCVGFATPQAPTAWQAVSLQPLVAAAAATAPDQIRVNLPLSSSMVGEAEQTAAAALGIAHPEEVLLVYKGQRWPPVPLAATLSGCEDEGADNVPVVHVVRRMTSRLIQLTVRMRGMRHAISMRQSSSVDELAALVMAQTGMMVSSDSTLQLVFRGKVLNGQEGIPVVEYGVDDGSTIMAISRRDVHAPATLMVKALDAPGRTVTVCHKTTVAEIKKMIAEQLPASIVKRLTHLRAGRSVAFLAVGGGGVAQRMADDETFTLHGLGKGRVGAPGGGGGGGGSDDVLFLLPPAGAVSVQMPLGTSGGAGVTLMTTCSKEQAVGLEKCYEDGLKTAREELAGQLRRLADKQRADERRAAARRARRMKRERARAAAAARAGTSDAAKAPPPPTAKKKKTSKNSSGLQKGFFCKPAASRPQRKRLPVRAVPSPVESSPPSMGPVLAPLPPPPTSGAVGHHVQQRAPASTPAAGALAAISGAVAGAPSAFPAACAAAAGTRGGAWRQQVWKEASAGHRAAAAAAAAAAAVVLPPQPLKSTENSSPAPASSGLRDKATCRPCSEGLEWDVAAGCPRKPSSSAATVVATGSPGKRTHDDDGRDQNENHASARERGRGGTREGSPGATVVRCGMEGCRKKLKAVQTLMGRCRCGEHFCAAHRPPHQHACGVNRVVASRETIDRANPAVAPRKLQDI